MPETITVEVQNNYECGRESRARKIVPAPPPLPDDLDLADDDAVDDWLLDWMIENVPSGDGHPCGSRENALYTFTVADHPADRPELGGREIEFG